MGSRADIEETRAAAAEIEYFGCTLKVKNPRLASLLKDAAVDDVQVVSLLGDDAASAARRARPDGARKALDGAARLRPRGGDG